jgi:hypothetical protein
MRPAAPAAQPPVEQQQQQQAAAPAQVASSSAPLQAPRSMEDDNNTNNDKKDDDVVVVSVVNKDASKRFFKAISSSFGLINLFQLMQGRLEVLDETEADIVRELKAVVGSRRNIDAFLESFLVDLSRDLDEANLPKVCLFLFVCQEVC